MDVDETYNKVSNCESFTRFKHLLQMGRAKQFINGQELARQ